MQKSESNFSEKQAQTGHRSGFALMLLARFITLLVLILSLGFLIALASGSAHADAGTSVMTWPQFRHQVQEETKSSNRKGTALIVSSALLVGGSYALKVSDPVQNGVVGLIRTVGLLGIGEGAEQVWISDQRRIFQETLDRSYGLSEASKTQILQNYLELQREAKKHQNTIKIVTYSLVAAVNFYEATRQSDETVKTGLTFLGAVGLLRALTLTIDF